MSDELENLQQQADAIKAKIEMLQRGEGNLDQALGEFNHQARRVRDALERVGISADLELQLNSLDHNTKLTLDDIAENQVRRNQLSQELTAIEEKIGRINIDLE